MKSTSRSLAASSIKPKPKLKTKAKPGSKAKPAAEPRLSRQRRPQEMPADDWQRALRRQFGSEQAFEWQNLGDAHLAPVFSQFLVGNVASGGRYRVDIRGDQPGDNLCTCLDFATNDLGTCKHVEFTLARLQARRGGKAAFKRGFAPPYSEIYLHQAGQRTLRFRPAAGCPPALLGQAQALFEAGAGWVLPRARLADLDGFIQAVTVLADAAGHELRIDDRALAFVAQVRDAEHRQQVLATAYPEGAADPGLAGLLRTPLYAYQAAGALFAARSGRALLGDEMWARRCRPSRRPSCWPATLVCSGCWWSARPRSSSNGSANLTALPAGRRRWCGACVRPANSSTGKTPSAASPATTPCCAMVI